MFTIKTRSLQPALLIATLGLAVGCGDKPKQAKPVIRPVRTEAVKLGSGAQSRTFAAKSQAGTTSNLSFKVSGQLSKVLVKVGDEVKKGQLIAVVDDKDIRLQLRQAQAAYAQARAQTRNARANYQRTRKLYENRSVSVKDLDSARAAADSAKASLAAQGQAVALVRQQLGYCKLRSPLEGKVASVPANVNENIKAGQPVVTVNAGARPEVTFNVPESLIGQIKKGAKAKVRFDALSGEPCTAMITEVGVAAGGTAFPVVAQLINPRKEVRAGMAAEVTLEFGDAKAAAKAAKKLFVPAHAVMDDRGGRFVYVAEGQPGAQGTIARRPVKTGTLGPRGLEIESGLKVGERVVTAGVRFIQPGMKVRILGKYVDERKKNKRAQPGGDEPKAALKTKADSSKPKAGK